MQFAEFIQQFLLFVFGGLSLCITIYLAIFILIKFFDLLFDIL